MKNQQNTKQNIINSILNGERKQICSATLEGKARRKWGGRIVTNSMFEPNYSSLKKCKNGDVYVITTEIYSDCTTENEYYLKMNGWWYSLTNEEAHTVNEWVDIEA